MARWLQPPAPGAAAGRRAASWAVLRRHLAARRSAAALRAELRAGAGAVAPSQTLPPAVKKRSMALGRFRALPCCEPRGRGCRSICGRAVRPDVPLSDQASLAGVHGYHGPEQAHPAPQFLFLQPKSPGDEHVPAPGQGPTALLLLCISWPKGVRAPLLAFTPAQALA